MKDIVIKIDRKTSQVFLNKKVLGISGENLQGNLIFEFLDDFVDGVAWLELEIGQTKGYLALIKEDNSYKLPILSSLLANKGNITMQLRITESENVEGIPVFKSNEFYLEVKGAINSTETIEEQYPSWVDMVNEKINVIKTDGKGNKYLSDDGTYKYVQGGSSDGGNVDLSNYATKDELDKKVDKVAGKSLIADSEIQRLASVSNYDDTSIRNELNSKADLSDIPVKISELTNDSGFLTSYTETDPLFKASASYKITNGDITNWNSKSNFSGNYDDLTNKPTIPTVPTNVSSFTNDAGYLTSVPSEYVTETELNDAISGLGSGTGNVSSDTINSIVVVDALPETEVEGVLYLVKETTTTEDDGNLFDYTTAPIINGYVSTSGATISSYETRRTTYLAIEPSTTYKVTKTASSVFSVGTCQSEPVIGTKFNVTEKNSTGSEITITSGESDNYLAIFYTDTATCSVDEKEILQSIVVEKVS